MQKPCEATKNEEQHHVKLDKNFDCTLICLTLEPGARTRSEKFNNHYVLFHRYNH